MSDRAAFEAWAKASELDITQYARGGYVLDEVSVAWLAWQVATVAALDRAAAACSAMPVDPSEWRDVKAEIAAGDVAQRCADIIRSLKPAPSTPSAPA